MAVSYGFAQPPSYVEEWQRNLLQGAYDKTKVCRSCVELLNKVIAGFQPLQDRGYSKAQQDYMV